MSSPRSGPVILLGWDSADWAIIRPLLAAGQLPGLASLIKRGASGYLNSYAPYISPMLWATIGTGHWPHRHGVHGFAEFDSQTGLGHPITSATRQTKALWNILSSQGWDCGVVGWLGSHPAEPIHGVFVSDAFAHAPRLAADPWPVMPGSVYPPNRATDLGDLRARAADLDPGLLGLFLPRLKEIDLTKDSRPAQLLERLANLYTLHNTAIALLEDDRPDFLTVYFHFLDSISHLFMPFHPPKMAATSERDFELYQGVVNGAYRLLDLLLADLLKIAGPDATILLVSDHGFASGDRRPKETPRVTAGIAAWHEPQGIFLAAGPGIRPQSEPHGAVLADIVPTVLSLCDLPMGADMPGRVLTEILENSDVFPPIPSWETTPDIVAPPSAASFVPLDENLLLRQFVELGYIDPAVKTSPDISHLEARNNEWSLGLALMELGRPDLGLPHLEACHYAEPESPQYALHLARCQMQLGLMDEADLSAQTLYDLGEAQPRCTLLRAQIALARNQPDFALTLLDRLRHDSTVADEYAPLRRTALLQSGRFEDAARSFTADLERHPRHWLSWLGLANARFSLGHFSGAIDAAHSALALQARLPGAHAILIQALEKSGRTAEIPAARENLRRIFPNLPPEIEQKFLAAPVGSAFGQQLDKLSRQTGQTLRLRDEAAQRRQAFLAEKSAAHAGATPFSYIQAPPPTPPTGDFYLLVSGLPRSGTSLMMRMLAFAGTPLLTDGLREPDDDNPLGYFEWDDAKRLPSNPALITAAAGKAVKIVSPLLRSLPAHLRYRIIFLRRPAAEIALSQTAMLARHGKSSALPVAELTQQLEAHATETLAWLRAAPNVDLLEISFTDLHQNSAATLARVAEFVGPEHLPRPASMARAIKPALWRQRTSTS